MALGAVDVENPTFDGQRKRAVEPVTKLYVAVGDQAVHEGAGSPLMFQVIVSAVRAFEACWKTLGSLCVSASTPVAHALDRVDDAV